jgi:flagellar basal body rod protein FlgC
MSSALAIAQTGAAVAALRLDVSANNVANALTDGFQPSRVEATEQPGGGVSGSVVRPADPLAEARADRAVVAPSRTDLLQELMTQSRAAIAYRANLASARTADEVAQATMDLVR